MDQFTKVIILSIQYCSCYDFDMYLLYYSLTSSIVNFFFLFIFFC